MPINQDAIINLCTELSRAEDLKITVTESAKGACIVGGAAFAGGIVGGPVGLAVGGMLGSVVALTRGRGRFRSAVDVILFDMTPAQHQRLSNSVRNIVSDLRVEDATLLLPLVMANVGIKELVLKEIITFMRSEMSLAVNN